MKSLNNANREKIASAAVKQIAIFNIAATKIQVFYRNSLQRRYFSKIFTKLIINIQQRIRNFLIRRRYLALLRTRAPWKDLLRPNEAIVLTSSVIKTSGIRGVRSITKVDGPFKNLLASKKQRQLIFTSGNVLRDGKEPIAPPRLFYVDPISRTWKGDIPYDLQLISILTLSEKEFLIFSKQNEDKLDKEPIWSFTCLEQQQDDDDGSNSNTNAIDWIRTLRKPMTIMELVTLPNKFFQRFDDVANNNNNNNNRILNRRRFVNNNKVLINRLRGSSSLVIKNEFQGPLLMRQLAGPKKYFQYFFSLQGSNLFWMDSKSSSSLSSPIGGLTLTPTCRVRLLETPRVLPNLPNIAFWLYIPGRNKPVKFRTLDLETAQKWVEAIGLAIAKCEVETFQKSDIVGMANYVFALGKNLFEKDRSFLNSKIKFKEALDLCYSSPNTVKSPESKQIQFDCFEYRAKCNFMLGLYEKSLDDSNRALVLQPDNESCLRTRAACFERLNRFDESLVQYQFLMGKFPETCSDLQEIYDRVIVEKEKFLIKQQEGKALFSNKNRIMIGSGKAPAIARQNTQELSKIKQNSGILFIDESNESKPNQIEFEIDKSSINSTTTKRRFELQRKTSLTPKRSPSSSITRETSSSVSSAITTARTDSDDSHNNNFPFRRSIRNSGNFKYWEQSIQNQHSLGRVSFTASAEGEMAANISRRTNRGSMDDNDDFLFKNTIITEEEQQRASRSSVE